jgi:hypothetical protein
MAQAKTQKTYKGRFAETEKLNLVTDPDFWVEVRTRLNSGDKELADNEMFNVVAEARKGSGPMDAQQMVATMRPNMADYRRLIVQASLVDWNLTDVDGTKLPVDWRELDDDDFNMIYDHVDASNKKAQKTVAQQERFPG